MKNIDTSKKLEPKATGILFGSFNPPHIGHLDTIVRAKEALQLQEVMMVPTPQSPIKKNVVQADIKEKLAMCRILALPYRHWLKTSEDFKNAQTGYYGTLKASFSLATNLTRQNPHTKFYVIGGADNGAKFRLFIFCLRLATIVESLRQAKANISQASIKGIFTKIAEKRDNFSYARFRRGGQNLSSSGIRATIAISEKPEGCPPPLACFIRSRQLYRKNQL